MPASQQHITSQTPTGAEVISGGTTFRTWCPEAKEVYVVLHDFDIAGPGGWEKNPDDLLVQDRNHFWSGFFPGVKDGDPYRFWIVGTGGEGFKRDPYARELTLHGFPNCNCLVRDPFSYQWHDSSFRTPSFNDLQVYQLHIGVFFAEDVDGHDIRKDRVSKFLDVVNRIEYLADLGINAIMPLPFQECQGTNSKGYNGSDPFSPEMDYAVDVGELETYRVIVNRLLKKKGFDPISIDQLTGQINQLKAMIDLCHLYGIAVISDVVYNHAGPGFDDQSLRRFNRPKNSPTVDGIYFQNAFHAGGSVFAFQDSTVRQFLIDNAWQQLEEYHVDGLRYDQVTVMDENGGWFFCQDLARTVRFIKPKAVQIAEYWGNQRWRAVVATPEGMGFDVGYADSFRDKVRKAIAQAAGGAGAFVDLDAVRDALYGTDGIPNQWRRLQCVENHDLVDDSHTGNDRQPRMAALADSTNSRSWYARSRARVAMGLLLTAPGIPMIFMGQEFLEDKCWSDSPGRSDLFIYWAGLEAGDRSMVDFHRYTRDLMWLRRSQPAMRSEAIEVFHVHNENRILAFQRWIPDVGQTVVVIIRLNETTFEDHSYVIGFPGGGHWNEIFNSDVYDNWFNSNARGNYGGIDANGPPRHGMPVSAGITIPANSILVFAR